MCARNWSQLLARGPAAADLGPAAANSALELVGFLPCFVIYTLWELFSGLSSPNTLNCSLDVVLKEGGEMTTCRQCVGRPVIDYDHYARRNTKSSKAAAIACYCTEEYWVKSCPEDCKCRNPWIFFPFLALLSLCVGWRCLLEF